MSEYCNNFVFMDDGKDTFKSWQGLRGPYFTPYVDEHGNLSWTNNGGLPNPSTVNIAGKGIMLKGTCATTGDLPADPETGDAWAVGASEPFECYAWLGGSWVDLGLMFPKGDPGEGVPASGTTGQILKKSSNTDYDTEWADPDQADWDQADNTQPDYIKNKPSIPVIDDTLSTAGQAADAKAAGDGIKEAEQIVSYVENGAAASRNYTAGEYITWKGVAYYAKTNISSGASFVVDTNLTAVGNQGYTNHLKNTISDLSDSLKIKDGPTSGDFNSFITPGEWYWYTDASLRNLTNIPVDKAGYLTVKCGRPLTSTWSNGIQIYITIDERIFIRHASTDGSANISFSAWKSVAVS